MTIDVAGDRLPLSMKQMYSVIRIGGEGATRRFGAEDTVIANSAIAKRRSEWQRHLNGGDDRHFRGRVHLFYDRRQHVLRRHRSRIVGHPLVTLHVFELCYQSVA